MVSKLIMFQNVYKDKKVLVTGHTGFKGSWLSLWLWKLGAKVYGLSEYVPSNPSHYELLVAANPQLFVNDLRIDVRDVTKLQQAVSDIQPDVVFHLAAKPIVKDCMAHPKDAFDVNLGGTVNLLTILKDSPFVKAGVFITSDKCYENVEWEYGYRESDRLGGKDPYSASKACAEIAFSSYFRTYFQDSETKIATGRAGNVIGGGDWADFRIIPDCVRAWSQGKPLEIRSPESTRPWEHVLEPLSGYLQIGERLLNQDQKVIGESFNFGPDNTVVKTVLETIQSMSLHWPEGKWDTPEQNLSKGEAVLLKLCCDKAANRLGWKAALNYGQTIEMTSAWYRSFYDKSSSSMLDYSSHQIDSYCEIARIQNLLWTQS